MNRVYTQLISCCSRCPNYVNTWRNPPTGDRRCYYTRRWKRLPEPVNGVITPPSWCKLPTEEEVKQQSTYEQTMGAG